MNLAAIIFGLVNAVAIWILPRKWAGIPILAGAIYLAAVQTPLAGPFTVMRLLVLVGMIRVVARGDRCFGGGVALDGVLILWASWGVCSSVFHKDPMAALISMLGLIYDSLGPYFLFRIFLQDLDDLRCVAKGILLLLVPVGLEMFLEKIGDGNAFAVLGGVLETVTIRHGKLRAEGPFSHPILAGTVGAVCMPLTLLFWQRQRRMMLVGFSATAAIIFTCASSGPILTVFVAFASLAAWKIRSRLKLIRWGILFAIIGLALIMKDPVYYVLARIDLTGSSTGWHRAALIDSAIKHLDEWWLGGTDYTRHWMPSGVYWSPNHTDITNHYIRIGVYGGVPLMLLFIAALYVAFRDVGRALRYSDEASFEDRFLIWMLGSILTAHAVTFLSVCYFDQTIVFYYLMLAMIVCARVALAEATLNPLNEQSDIDTAPETLPEYG